MAVRRRSLRREWSDPQLERRELLSASARPPAAVFESPRTSTANLFHQNGIDGLTLHKSFVNQLNSRLAISESQAARVTQSFQVFLSNYEQTTDPSALSTLIGDLKANLAHALTAYEVLSNRPSPSVATSLKNSPLAPVALIPYADAQVDQLAATLTSAPAGSDPTPAANVAVNAILNALAETSIHPRLFLSPTDFYISPNVSFDVNFTGTPASTSPGFFVRGPHGAILPGANVRPHVAL